MATAQNARKCNADGMIKLRRHLGKNHFGDVLADCANRLPLPCILFLTNMAQTREWEVKAKHQSLLSRSPLQKPTPSGHDLLRSKIDRCMPLWLLQMNGMEHHIADA
jgi:hypothetical protein